MRYRMSFTPRRLALSSLLCVVAACSDNGGAINENEVITTITLAFAPSGGGPSVTATFNDPDGDGGQPPTVDPISLASGTSYAMTVRFQNQLESPPGEITDEVRDEADDHQVFFTGSAINGPATSAPTAPLTHSYADTDAGGLPVGLANTIVAATGAGQLILTLRHMPPVNGVAAKVAGLAAQVKTAGLAALPGATDAQVTFTVTVR
jgi:hypothetical protein